LNHISQSEIVRVLIENSKVKIDTRNLGTVISEAMQKGKTNKSIAMIYLPEKLLQKANKMRLENNASFSEIVRCLVMDADFNKADFNKLKFKNISEVYKEAIKKNKEKSK
jgi:hypothetical protein